MDDRLDHIDVSRGVSILLIVFIHVGFVQSNMWYFERFSFVVPMFFLISGVFFNVKLGLKEIVFRRFDTLLKPYLVVLMFLGLAISIRSGFDGFPNYMLGVFYGVGSSIAWTPMWFIPHLFLINLMAWFLIRFILSKRGRVISSLNLIMFGFISYFVFLMMDFYFLDMVEVRTGYLGLPFSFDFSFLSLFYFFVGLSYRKEILDFKFNIFYFMTSIVVVVSEYYWFMGAMDFNMRRFDSFLSVCVSSFAGMYLVFSASHFLSKLVFFNFIFSYVGKVSLFILMFHVFFIKKTEGVLNTLGLDSHLLWPLVLVISVLLSIMIYEVTLRFKAFSFLLLPKVNRT